MPFGSIEMKASPVPEPEPTPMSSPVVIHWYANGRICLYPPAFWSPFPPQEDEDPGKKCNIDIDSKALLEILVPILAYHCPIP